MATRCQASQRASWDLESSPGPTVSTMSRAVRAAAHIAAGLTFASAPTPRIGCLAEQSSSTRSVGLWSVRPVIAGARWPRWSSNSRANSPEVPPETIQRAVAGEYDDYDNSAILDFVPILVERPVRAELRHRG